MRKRAPIILALAITALPLFASAQSASPIIECNRTGADAMTSIGSTVALGTSYVPVADAAVELNTGMLVYKECVVRQAVIRLREAALANFLKKNYQAIQTGRNGNPMYFVNPSEITNVADAAFVDFLQDGTLSNLNPAIRSDVTRALVQSYSVQTREPAKVLTCPYQGDLGQWAKGGVPYDAASAWAAAQPACNSFLATLNAQNLAATRVAIAVQNAQTQLDWGRGFYPVTDQNGNVVTPASAVEQSFEQLLQSPVQQLQSADDIGQMIGALYAGVTTQIVADDGGLAGISQSYGGQRSYLDQLVAQSIAGLNNTVTNIALQVLTSALQREQEYLRTITSISSYLDDATRQLQTAEKQCWALIIPKVCASTLSSSKTCQAADGSILKVATSTVYSDAVINAQIAPRATSTAANIAISNQAIGIIQNLISSVQNAPNASTQSQVLSQYDQHVANHRIHSPTDLQNAASQLSSMQLAMQTLIQNTLEDWADSTPDGNKFSASNTAGWCNVNEQVTLDTWRTTWKQ